jgi:hypothetical protein
MFCVLWLCAYVYIYVYTCPNNLSYLYYSRTPAAQTCLDLSHFYKIAVNVYLSIRAATVICDYVMNCRSLCNVLCIMFMCICIHICIYMYIYFFISVVFVVHVSYFPWLISYIYANIKHCRKIIQILFFVSFSYLQ